MNLLAESIIGTSLFQHETAHGTTLDLFQLRSTMWHPYNVISLIIHLRLEALIPLLIKEVKLLRLILSLLWHFSCPFLLEKVIQELCDMQSKFLAPSGSLDLLDLSL